MLPIPLATTPQFSTGIVSVEWRLGFEFVLAAGGVDTPPVVIEGLPGGDTIVVGPAAVEVDKIKWNMPISVLPTNPVNLPSINAVVTDMF